jgi:hypothetical protein
MPGGFNPDHFLLGIIAGLLIAFMILTGFAMMGH